MPRKPKITEFGSDAYGIVITGDPKNQEPTHTRITFPGGDVEVTRAREGKDADYWIHVRVNRPDKMEDGDPYGVVLARMTDARIDSTDKATSQNNTGDFDNPNVYHIAVRVTPEGINVPWYKRGLDKDDQA